MNRVPLALDCVKTRVPLAPPSWVASGTGIPADPDRSKASGHTQRSTPPEPRRPTPSRWPEGSPEDAGRDRVLKPDGPFPAARAQWPPEPVFVPLRRSHDDRFRLNRANRPFPGVVLTFPAPTAADPRPCRNRPLRAHPDSPENPPFEPVPVLHTVPMLHRP